MPKVAIGRLLSFYNHSQSCIQDLTNFVKFAQKCKFWGLSGVLRSISIYKPSSSKNFQVQTQNRPKSAKNRRSVPVQSQNCKFAISGKTLL